LRSGCANGPCHVATLEARDASTQCPSKVATVKRNNALDCTPRDPDPKAIARFRRALSRRESISRRPLLRDTIKRLNRTRREGNTVQKRRECELIANFGFC
jgi:hypothetical protein